MHDDLNQSTFHEQFERNFQTTPHFNQKGTQQMAKRMKSSLKLLSVASQCLHQACVALKRLQRRYPNSQALRELAQDAHTFDVRLRRIREAIEMNLEQDLEDYWEELHNVE